MKRELPVPQTDILLANPSGAGTIYHIMIGQYYNGQVCKTLHGWRIYLAKKSDITKEQEQLILKVLTEKNG